MFLKSLIIHGFKSFPDKTTLEFSRGITSVVGPNGSGKSNISDAASWVLGEQSAKSLRGGKMEDVIFSGTQTRKGMGFAKVNMVIDNEDNILDMDSNEVTISRKYYRSGESEYSVNGNVVRLRDVQELLMDTGLGRDGYAVIGQGKISEIVSAKSQDRRQIFEEAAGISKFRYRKIRSERQLEHTKENLVRLKDILGEIEDRIEPLKKQSIKAKQFLEWSVETKLLEISLNTYNLDSFKKTLKEYDNKLTIIQLDYEKAERKLLNLEEKTKDVYNEINLCSVDIEKFRKEKQNFEKENSDKNSQIAVYENDIFHKKENINRLKNEVKMARTDFLKTNLLLVEKENEIKIIEEKIKKYGDKKEKEQNNLNEIVSESFLKTDLKDKLNISIYEITSKISEHKIKEMTILTSIDGLKDREKTIENSRESLQEQIEFQKVEIAKRKEQNSAFEKKLSEKAKYLEKEEKILFSKKEEAIKSEKELLDVRNTVTKAENRVGLLRDLEESMDDFTYSVKTILNGKKAGQLKGIHGPVSNIISVSNKYTLAMETALSFSLQNIVVDNENAARLGIAFLLNKKAGRATFLPMTSVKGSKLKGVSGAGFEGIAADLVDFDSKYEGIIYQLLGRVCVVDNIDNGIEIAKKNGYKFRIVTLDGQVINAGGSFTGGSKVKTSGILSRKNEIKQLIKDVKSFKIMENEKEKINTEIAVEMVNLENKINLKREELSIVDQDRKENRYNFNSLKSSLQEKENQQFEFEKSIKEFKSKVEELKEENIDVIFKKEELVKALLESEKSLDDIDDGEENLKEKRESLTANISYYKIEVLKKEKDLAVLAQTITDYTGQRDDSDDKMKNVQIEIDFSEKEIVDIVKDIENFKESIEKNIVEIEKLDIKVEKTIEKRNGLEASTADARKKERELLREREEVSKEKIRLEERKNVKQIEYDKIVLKLWDEYELTVSKAKEQAVELKNIKNSEILLKSLKSQIRLLGSVNVAAIEEYKEISKRYEFLKNQIEDVLESKAELKNLINKLTKTMQEMFVASFKEINIQFKEIFTDLFEGGEADLSLTNPEDVLESGIEINVQPPGKIIKNLSSLSGGEKSFVAIAIYFAILKVKPAPFCLLDEIEAALDDVNVIKFATYLRTLTNKTQFIAISHRRGTMEEADTLYGVTMQEEGVSKLLKLKLSEVETSLGMKAI